MGLGGATVEISFCDARLCADFNSFNLLSKRYGLKVAHSISTRMGVLKAAPTLIEVPRKPPVGLRAEKGTFTVSLAESRRLRFQSSPGAAPDKELEKVTHIEILGVEE